MLDIDLIRGRMAALDLNQAALSERCGVSKEAVSNWLSGESVPRPRKLRALSEALEIDVEALLKADVDAPEPVVAYRTKKNRPATDRALEAARESAVHLRELVSFFQENSLFAPPVLQDPRLDDDYVNHAAMQTRQRIGLTERAPLTRDQLIELHKAFGSVLVPVLWGDDKSGHENALSVYLPQTKTSCVVFSLNARVDDFNYWLAHELGHCYTLPALSGDDGEAFAERFAQELLFPHAAAAYALEEIAASDDPMARALFFAEAHDISIVTVIRQIDRVAKSTGLKLSGLDTPQFWDEWNSNRVNVPTVAHSLFGTANVSLEIYVKESERIFGTPIFQAIARWQDQEGGRSPSFIASTLNTTLDDATALSHYLVKHYAH
ncbi:antirepressor [Caballeronia jiangsuensis]|nr:antirepressor [Caballeronia jiangsuensis]